MARFNLAKLVDLNTLPVKCLYFFVKMQIFSFYFFRAKFVTTRFDIDIGDYTKYVGVLLFATFFSNMVIAYINDRFKKPRTVLFTLLIGATLCFESFYFIPHDKTQIFWAAIAGYLIFETGVTPLLDYQCMNFLQHTAGTHTSSYGRQRLFGALAYLVTNYITENYCKTGEKQFNFEMLRYMVPMLTLPGLIAIYFVVRNYSSPRYQNQNKETVIETAKEENEQQSEQQGSFFSQLRVLMNNSNFIFFLFIILLNGITRSAIGMFLPHYQTTVLRLEPYELSDKIPLPLRNLIQPFNKNAISTSTSFGTLTEISFLFLSFNITKHFGMYWPLFFAQIAHLLRNLGYFLMPPDHKHTFLISCFLETAKGINFSLTHASGVQIAHALAPKHLKTTAQILYAGAFFSVSSLISGLTFGEMFKYMKRTSEGKSDYVKSYNLFFSLNLCINLFFLSLFVVKYGLFDGELPISVFYGKKFEKKKQVVEIKETEKAENIAI